MRSPRALALFTVLAPLLAVIGVSQGPANAAGFDERWCVNGYSAPCIESATRDDVAVLPTDATWAVLATGKLTDIGYPYFHFMVQPKSGGPPVAEGDHWVITFRTGAMEPRYTEAYAGAPVVTRTQDGDGTWHLTYDAYAVRTTDGCDADAAWPWPCPTTATSTEAQLSGEVHKKDDLDFNGFDMAQNVDGTNGIFLETAPDGSRYLSTEVVNSHQYDADPGPGTTLQTFTGQLRFRIPYAMLKNAFGVPNPATMDAGSLSGTAKDADTGTVSPAAWTVNNDTSGKTLVVDVTGITFSTKILKVKRGVVTPTAPTDADAHRTGAHRGRIEFGSAQPRGAKVTGYGARCVAANGRHVVTTTGTDSPLVVKGLREGVAYDCKVRGLSMVGTGAWSGVASMSGTVVHLR